jgi:hypothetical protein
MRVPVMGKGGALPGEAAQAGGTKASRTNGRSFRFIRGFGDSNQSTS